MKDQPTNTPEFSTPPETKILENPSDVLLRVREEYAKQQVNKGRVIDLYWCLNFFERQGKRQFGSKFRIYREDHEIIYKLVIYFLRHEKESERLNLDLDKGILLTGPIGSGKTLLMTLMKLVPPLDGRYIMKPCRDVSFEFIREGYEVINRYSHMSYAGQRPRTYCFDDLGAEQSLKYYGNECNVMAEILLNRYDQYVSQRMITHVTTNLSASEIETMYGNRLRSRLREMNNLIAFPGVSVDKRV